MEVVHSIEDAIRVSTRSTGKTSADSGASPASAPVKALVLINGSTVSTQLLSFLSQHYEELIALSIDFGTLDRRHVEQIAQSFAVPLDMVDARSELDCGSVQSLVWSGAMLGNAGCPSRLMSKALVAKIAVTYARGRGLGAIFHAETHAHSTLGFLNKQIINLGFKGVIGCPFNKTEDADSLPNPTGLNQSAAFKNCHKSSYWSVEHDVARANLEEEFRIAEHEFNWPHDEQMPGTTCICIQFQSGVAGRLNGVEMPHEELVKHLNELVGPLGLGRMMSRYTHGVWEDLNLELTEAPAVYLLSFAYHQLELYVLEREAREMKSQLASKWLSYLLEGDFYSEEKRMAEESLAYLAQRLTGSVTIMVSKGRIATVSVELPTKKRTNGFEPNEERMA